MRQNQRIIRCDVCDHPLILKRALGPDRMVDDYDVLSEGEVVGRILKSGPMAKPWFWEFSYGYHYDRSPAHGYEATREDAMAAFRKGWLPE